MKTPTVEDLTRRCCEQMAIERSRASPLFAAILQAVLDEQERCRRAVLRVLSESGLPGGELAELTLAVEDAIQPEAPNPEVLARRNRGEMEAAAISVRFPGNTVRRGRTEERDD